MKKMGMMEIAGLISEGADKGIMAFAPILLQTMPGAVRVAYIQRVACVIAERAALLSRMCGDAQADALVNKRDVAPEHLAQLQRMTDSLARAPQQLPRAENNVGTDDLARAYAPPQAQAQAPKAAAPAPPQAPPQAARVMATKAGGL